MSDCTVYIDEAGDLGFQRGTRWFVLSAVVVDKAQEPTIRITLSQIKSRLNINYIHLRKITDFYKRAYITKELSKEIFTYMNVVVDTNKLNLAMAASASIAYNYTCRMLLERVSWYLRDNGKIADVILSARGTSRDQELIQYIKQRLIPYTNNEITGCVCLTRYLQKQPPPGTFFNWRMYVRPPCSQRMKSIPGVFVRHAFPES